MQEKKKAGFVIAVGSGAQKEDWGPLPPRESVGGKRHLGTDILQAHG
jgi:hypothetical protein